MVVAGRVLILRSHCVGDSGVHLHVRVCAPASLGHEESNFGGIEERGRDEAEMKTLRLQRN